MHSTHRKPARRSARIASVLLLAGVVSACRDLPAPADPIARPISASASARAAIYDASFDRYTASVVVTMSGGGIRRLPAMPERRVEYGVERQLERGTWTTTYDFSAGVREAGTQRRASISRVVAGVDGMKYYDHEGNLIPLGSRLPELPNGADFPAPPEATPRAAQGGDPRAWADNLVTSPAIGARRRAEIEQSFQRAGVRGRSVRYRKDRDGVVTEIVLDTTRGTIEETRLSGRATRHTSTRFEYQDIGNDRWLRVRAVQQQEDRSGERHPLIVEQVFVDQRFLRSEGR